jgi:hypothetical protein
MNFKLKFSEENIIKFFKQNFKLKRILFPSQVGMTNSLNTLLNHLKWIYILKKQKKSLTATINTLCQKAK